MNQVKLVYLLFACILVTKSFSQSTEITVPVGGNSWVSSGSDDNINEEGWGNWNRKESVYTTYVKVFQTGTLKVKANIEVPKGKSRIRCTIAGKSKEINVKGAQKDYLIGEWRITDTGYIAIEMKGISKTGSVFAKLSNFSLSGSSIDKQTAYVKDNEGNYFYWGRRGPSVHLSYDFTHAGNEIEYFYSEIEVPAGNDVIGSYYMANGFGEGYFGMQVNSVTERRVLFSVWSPFQTDDPTTIPEDEKILMVKKGKEVYTGEFGNEGSGGQSFLRYNWKTGNRYRFLLRGLPIDDGYTNYTAYFFAPEENKWRLIASFSRPKISTYLTRFHSFLENFTPHTGNTTRKAYFLNQWVREKNGTWFPINKAHFTGDATAKKRYRLDYAGGVENDKLFLKNNGFFNETTPLGSVFSLNTNFSKPPDIDLLTLE